MFEDSNWNSTDSKGRSLRTENHIAKYLPVDNLQYHYKVMTKSALQHSGQSYKCFAIVMNNLRVLTISNLVVNNDTWAFIRLFTGPYTEHLILNA